MVFLLRQDTNLSPNCLALMALPGAISAVGLWAYTLHVVIGVVVAGFELLVQVSFGLVTGPRQTTWSGVLSPASGYILVFFGGLLSLLILDPVAPIRSTNLQARFWVHFRPTVAPAGIVASAFGAAAGAFVISGQRSVLTTGIMIALALIPSMAIVGMNVGVGDFTLAGRAPARWLVDGGLGMVVSAGVLMLKRWYLCRHRVLS